MESISLPVDGRHIAAIRQCDPDLASPPKLLCIHGWLDNANSFLPLMPYLPSFDTVAIDLPGHGHSDALPQSYSFHEICYQLTRTIEALGWSQCHIVGHSLGGCIAPMLAVANPDLVQSLTLIDACGPMSEEADKLPARLQRALQDRLNPGRFESRLFASKKDAVEGRLKVATMEPASARLIMDRQLRQCSDGFRWQFDPKWRHASVQYQTEAQVRAILSAVSCKTLTVMADKGFLVNRQETQGRVNCLQNNQHVALPGHHHLHMDSPEPVAASINRFLNARPNLGD